MATHDEDNLLRSVGLKNARSVHQARQCAEDNLRKESTWLQVTLGSIGDAVISTDVEGRVTFMNRAAESLTGWSLNEAQGNPLPNIFRILNEHTREPVENPAERALREGAVVALANHTVLVARDGSEKPIDDSAAPMRDENGNPVGAVLVFRDVSERKRAEEAQARLAAIVESSEDAIISKTLDGIIRTWNAGAERLLGYTPEEAIGKSITLIIPPERLQEEQLIIERLVRGERVEHFETVRVCKDGRRIDISLTISPVRDSAGHVIGASKVARDVTRIRQTEHQLAVLLQRERDHSRLLRKVADAALTIHSAQSLESVLRVVAEEARSVVGASQAISSLSTGEQWEQRNRAVALAPRYDDLEGADTSPPFGVGLHAGVCRSNRPQRLSQAELEADPDWQTADGSKRAGMRGWLAAPLISRSGRNLGLIQLFDKNADEDGFTENDEAVLVQLAHIASVAIENAGLYGELREADRRKDEFLALLAHELRNPLAPLRNGLELVRMDCHEDVSEATEMMDRQLTHMVRLIDDLLDISRISRNKMDLRLARVSLAEVLNSAVETAQAAIRTAGHELVVSLPPEPIYLHADMTRLAQVFGNLLSNSAKYTPKGGRIWVTASRGPHQIVVTVQDTGIGIPAYALRTIFDMFSQVDRTIERTTGGLGIGLALVRGLTEMHGGSVEASSPGQGLGSTFTVRLPFVEDRHVINEGSAVQGTEAPKAKKRILVVDDSRDSAITMAMMLRKIGHEASTAHDGLEALTMAEQLHPQVILMDIGMPRLNGYEATRKIREQPWGRDISIIALTGWGNDADREKSREAGCDGHLVKPVNLSDLKRLFDSNRENESSNPGPGV